MSCTTPSGCSRTRLIDNEALIDLDEWACIHGHIAPFPVPSGITVALWSKLEQIPFRLVGKITLEDRVLQLVARVRACLDTRLRNVDPRALAGGITVAFSARLPYLAAGREQQPLAVHCGPCGTCPLSLTIGLPEELPKSPPPAAATRPRGSRTGSRPRDLSLLLRDALPTTDPSAARVRMAGDRSHHTRPLRGSDDACERAALASTSSTLSWDPRSPALRSALSRWAQRIREAASWA